MEILIESLETRQQRYNSLVFATGPGSTRLVADAGKLRRLSCSQDDIIYFLPVAATSLRAGFQVYLSKLWVVDVTKEMRYDLFIACSQILFYTFYLLLQPLLDLTTSQSLITGVLYKISCSASLICSSLKDLNWFINWALGDKSIISNDF